MKSRDGVQVQKPLTSEQKWAIGTGIFLGVPLGGAVGASSMLATSLTWYATGSPPFFAKSFAKASFCFQEGGTINTLRMLKCPYFSVPAVATVATCAAAGFFLVEKLILL